MAIMLGGVNEVEEYSFDGGVKLPGDSDNRLTFDAEAMGRRFRECNREAEGIYPT